MAEFASMQPISYSNDPVQNPYREPPPPAPLPRVSVIDAFKFAVAPEGGLETILYGVLCLIIPVVGPIVLKGYEADIFQRLVRREAVPLPRFQFNAFSSYLTRGLPTFVVELLVWIPITVVWVVAMVFGMFGLLAVAGGVHDSHAANAAVPFAFFGFGSVAMSLSLLAFSVLVNAAATRAALTEDIGASLNLKEILAYSRQMLWPTIVAMIAFGFVAACVASLGILAFFICLYPALFIIQIALTHVRFQIYERYVAGGGTPIPPKPQALPAYGYGGYAPGHYPQQAGHPQQGYGGYQPPPNAQGYPPPRYPGAGQ